MIRKVLQIVVFTFFVVSQLQAKKITVTSITELTNAINAANAGDTIYVHGRTYKCDTRIKITRSGTEKNKICLFAFPGDSERPKFDFSSMKEEAANQGFALQASYWHIKGLDIFKAGDNGMQLLKANHNIIEFCTFSECFDSGMQISGGSSDNLILNCDSFFNADSKLENADGFACKMDVGTGNIFRGCRAWNNLDDGWDGYLRGIDSSATTYENCWAFMNGYLKTGQKSGGDGNGFKTGGSDDKLKKHNATFVNCIASGNVAHGFDHNSNRGQISLYNCSVHNNGVNLSFGKKNPVSKLIIKNTLVLGEMGITFADASNISGNSWQDGLTCGNADFQSIDASQLSKARKKDGSLPDITYLRLTKNSKLMGKGISVH